MDRIIYLKKKNGEIVKGTFKKLDSTYIDKIMEFQEEILEGLEDKQLYAPTDREDFYKYYKRISSIIGCFTEKEEFIAMAVYIKNDYDEETINFLLGIHWWDNDKEWFLKHWELLSDIDKLKDYYISSKSL